MQLNLLMTLCFKSSSCFLLLSPADSLLNIMPNLQQSQHHHASLILPILHPFLSFSIFLPSFLPPSLSLCIIPFSFSSTPPCFSFSMLVYSFLFLSFFLIFLPLPLPFSHPPLSFTLLWSMDLACHFHSSPPLIDSSVPVQPKLNTEGVRVNCSQWPSVCFLITLTVTTVTPMSSHCQPRLRMGFMGDFRCRKLCQNNNTRTKAKELK